MLYDLRQADPALHSQGASMMKIVYKTGMAVPKTTTINDIPVGQVFRGTLVGPLRKTTGVFWKRFGNWTQGEFPPTGVVREAIVIRLDQEDDASWAPLTYRCVPVENYEPIEATLTIG